VECRSLPRGDEASAARDTRKSRCDRQRAARRRLPRGAGDPDRNRAGPAMGAASRSSVLIRAGAMIRVIQRRAYGLRDEDHLRLKILTCMLPEI
jgi:hypothetical protein